ncbi:hypothetical protein SK128_019896, partial [Halocaridina rubra]
MAAISASYFTLPRYYVFVFLLSFGFLLQKTQGRCPDECDCLGAIVDCSNVDLREVPRDLPQWVEK